MSRVYATGSNKAKVAMVLKLKLKNHYDSSSFVVNELGKVGKLI
jgi:hypothetical protein